MFAKSPDIAMSMIHTLETVQVNQISLDPEMANESVPLLLGLFLGIEYSSWWKCSGWGRGRGFSTAPGKGGEYSGMLLCDHVV